MIITQSKTALAPGLSASFLAAGGNAPYTYSVAADGAGGTINASTGVYTAPAVLSEDPKRQVDTIIATDALGGSFGTISSTILIAHPLLLFCEILEREMGLAPGRVYLYNQKIMQPTDSGIFIAVSILSDKPFGNINRSAQSGAGLKSEQYISASTTLGVDIISRGPGARDRRLEILLALGSTYSQQQQNANSFYIARLPSGSRFVNLSTVDGAAIPYRFHIDIDMQYAYSKSTPIFFYDDFQQPELNIDPI